MQVRVFTCQDSVIWGASRTARLPHARIHLRRGRYPTVGAVHGSQRRQSLCWRFLPSPYNWPADFPRLSERRRSSGPRDRGWVGRSEMAESVTRVREGLAFVSSVILRLRIAQRKSLPDPVPASRIRSHTMAPETCANCRKTHIEADGARFQACSRCRSVRYCQKSCQVADVSASAVLLDLSRNR